MSHPTMLGSVVHKINAILRMYDQYNIDLPPGWTHYEEGYEVEFMGEMVYLSEEATRAFAEEFLVKGENITQFYNLLLNATHNLAEEYWHNR